MVEFFPYGVRGKHGQRMDDGVRPIRPDSVDVAVMQRAPAWFARLVESEILWQRYPTEGTVRATARS